MKWFPFGILGLIAIVLQTSPLRDVLAIHSIWPIWTFILVVHYALWGPWPDAAIAAWILGLVVDLLSEDPAGLHAFCYGGAAWIVFRVRQAVFRDHPVTHALLTLVLAVVTQIIVGIYRWWRLPADESEGWIMTAFFFALYTGVWAPLLHWPLLKLKRWTGLGPGRPHSTVL